MKRFIAFSVALIFICAALCSCGKKTVFSPTIKLAEGYTLSGDTISASFYNKRYIDIYSDITFSDGAAKLYSDDTFEEYFEDGLLPVNDGRNAFVFRVTQGEDERIFKVEIENTMIKSIFIRENYSRVYGVGEGFDRKSVTVTAKLLRGGEIEITDYTALSNFDGEGRREIMFSCGGCYAYLEVEVRGENVPTLDENGCDSSGAKYKISGGEAILTDGRGVYGYFTVPAYVISGGEKYPVTELSPYCFDSNESLTGVTVGGNVKKVGEGAFYDCIALRSATLSGTEKICGYAFFGCASLYSVTLPEELCEISDGLFSGCAALSEIIIPDKIEVIGPQAFIGCCSLSDIIIPESVRRIGARAFKNCDRLETIICGAGVEELGRGAFSFCESLFAVVVPELAESEAGLCEGCPNVTIYSGKTSMAIYYAKKAGIKTEVLKNDTINIIGFSRDYFLGDEISAEDFSVVLYTENYLGATENYGVSYDFTLPGTRRVTVTSGKYSAIFDVFVSYIDYLSGSVSDVGAEYELDDDSMTASLLSIPNYMKNNTFTVPTSVVSNENVYEVTGISDGAVRSESIEKLLIHSGIKSIGDGAIADCARLSLVAIGVRTGVALKIGDGNFFGLSENLTVLCEYKNSVMHNYVRKNKINYAGTDTGTLYITSGTGAKTSYKNDEKFSSDGFYFIYVGEGWEIKYVPAEEIEFSYDFSADNTVRAEWNGMLAETKVNVE